MKLTHSFFHITKKIHCIINFDVKQYRCCKLPKIKMIMVSIQQYENSWSQFIFKRDSTVTLLFLFLNNFSSVRIEKAQFFKKLCFSIFRTSYRHFLPTDKQYQCNIMLSLLSQVGHSLPFLRLERFFYWVQMRHFYLLLFQGFKQQQKVILQPKIGL